MSKSIRYTHPAAPVDSEGPSRRVKRMLAALQDFSNARTEREVVRTTARFLEEDIREEPVPLADLGLLRVDSVEDIDACIARIQMLMHASPLMGHDEERVDRLLSFLLVASIRARQVR